ncbi:TetR family transcriptional regulator [Nocardioides sp. HDW12B]|uniref:TetR/AcrR family transcriptional regulator n=1 Tax=Nocardioides sp. HDW12B TaxID=2714939 RepID=UPI00140DB48E|nr:TetR/AcrR family transcriptional regulator [Nocardioides sp. HDW12B]QIK67325.1 TetR family transcriptional regulator [Nocardioides sp. HDW12B]
MLHRITLTAQRLTDDRGLDGFTMDDLAAAVDVSRRTLFNYYPSKVDAVLGPDPDLDDEVWATFVAGGPYGDLVEDLIALAAHVLEAKTLTREELALGRRVMLAEPRLLAAVHERLASVSADLGALLVARTGEKLDLATAQLLVRVLAATFDCALDRALSDDTLAADAMPQLVAENIRALRDLFTGAYGT